MKPIITILSLLFIGGVAVWAFWGEGSVNNSVSSESASSLWIENTEIDFGTMPPRDAVRKHLQVKNKGDATFEVKKIIANCSCNWARIKPATIPPDGIAELTIELKASPMNGEMVRDIIIVGANGEELGLKVKATVYSKLMAMPERLNFGVFETEELPLSRTLTLRTADGSDFPADVKLKPDDRFVTVTDNILVNPDERRVTVQINKDTPAGEIASTIRVKGSGPERYKAISLGGLHLAPEQAQPRSIFFGRVGRGDSKKASVKVSGTASQELSSVQIVPEEWSDYLEFQVKEDGQIDFEFRMPEESRHQSISGIAYLRWNESDRPLSIPFQVMADRSRQSKSDKGKENDQRSAASN